MRHTLAVGVAVVALVAACSGGDDDATPTTLPGDGVELEDDPAGDGNEGLDLSDTVLEGLESGEVAFADYAGRPVVVNFFASTCAPCVEEMPDIESVKQELGDAVAFVGVATNDRVDDAVELAEETGVTWDLARDPFGEFIATVGGVLLPTTVLVGGDGRVVDLHTGQVERDELRGMLRDHFGIGA